MIRFKGWNIKMKKVTFWVLDLITRDFLSSAVSVLTDTERYHNYIVFMVYFVVKNM